MMKTSIDDAIALLKNGDVVAFPTETVYGLGADAWNPSAIKKVFAIKGRPADNPLIVHIASKQDVCEFAQNVPSEAENLMDAFWPGPLTLIFKKKPEVPDLITAGLPTVALRWPNHPLAQELIMRAGPLVAPSANSSGKPSPTRPEHVIEDFGNDFPVLEAGETNIGLESTVLDISEAPFRIYRPGNIGKSALEKVLGQSVLSASSNEKQTAAKSPGTKYSHYSPRADVRWLGADEQVHAGNVLYLFHSFVPKRQVRTPNVICYDNNYQKMARELYDRFREADHKKLDEVVIEPFDKKSDELPPIVDALINRIEKAIS